MHIVCKLTLKDNHFQKDLSFARNNNFRIDFVLNWDKGLLSIITLCNNEHAISIRTDDYAVVNVFRKWKTAATIFFVDVPALREGYVILTEEKSQNIFPACPRRIYEFTLHANVESIAKQVSNFDLFTLHRHWHFFQCGPVSLKMHKVHLNHISLCFRVRRMQFESISGTYQLPEPTMHTFTLSEAIILLID